MKNKFIFLIPLIMFFVTGCGEEEWMCLNGYVLDEATKTCSRTVEKPATLNYYCDGQNEKVEGKQCKKTITHQATPSKVCNPGFSMEGGLCVKDGTIANIIQCGANRTYNESNGECYDKISAVTIYKCDVGDLEGSTCVQISYSDAKTEYVCDDNKYTAKGDTCYYTITMEAKNTKED